MYMYLYTRVYTLICVIHIIVDNIKHAYRTTCSVCVLVTKRIATCKNYSFLCNIVQAKTCKTSNNGVKGLRNFDTSFVDNNLIDAIKAFNYFKIVMHISAKLAENINKLLYSIFCIT